MTTWREELEEAIKSQTERDAEEAGRRRKRLEEALKVADEALTSALDGLRFAGQRLTSKEQPSTLTEGDGGAELSLHGESLKVGLDRAEAVLRVTFGGARPREFDFAKDRHIAPKDVEEYVGRRTVELARAAKKSKPW